MSKIDAIAIEILQRCYNSLSNEDTPNKGKLPAGSPFDIMMQFNADQPTFHIATQWLVDQGYIEDNCITTQGQLNTAMIWITPEGQSYIESLP